MLDAVSFVGKPIFLVLVIGIPTVWLFVRGEHRLVVYLVATALTGGIVDTFIKETVDRRRPEFDFEVGSAYGTSFPSGHTLASTVCYGAMLLVALPYIHDAGDRPRSCPSSASCRSSGSPPCARPALRQRRRRGLRVRSGVAHRRDRPVQHLACRTP